MLLTSILGNSNIEIAKYTLQMYFHYLEEYCMDKAEILEKSRKENKGRDISEDEQSKNAARFGVVFGVCFMVIITFLVIHKL